MTMDLTKSKKIVPVVTYAEDGTRTVVGQAEIRRSSPIKEMLVSYSIDDMSINVTLRTDSLRHIFSMPADELSMAVETDITFRKPPCEWKNNNICVAEGCFGEACLKGAS